MERNYDEVIADMLIQFANMEARLERENRRLDLTIKRMVKAESRMDLFDRKLEQSISAQRDFFEMQSKMNKYFLDRIKN